MLSLVFLQRGIENFVLNDTIQFAIKPVLSWIVFKISPDVKKSFLLAFRS